MIGASRDRHKLGYGVVRNLHEYHYRGQIYPVNPHAREVLGYPCYPDISAVPKPVDLAVVVVPADYVIPVVTACGEHGVPAVVVVSGGFSEVGPQGVAREVELKQVVAERYQMQLLGPELYRHH